MKPFLLDGSWVDAVDSIAVHNPEDGSLVATVAKAGVEHVDLAIASAEKVVDRPPPGHVRASLLCAAAERLSERADEAAQVIATEGIKTIREARGEVTRAVETLRLSGEEAKRISGQTLNVDQYESGENRFGFAVRMPVGIIGAITPFNDPLNLVAHKVGPALAAGNAVVLKPDSKTPLSALLLAEVLVEVGLEPGWLHVLPGDGSVVGDAIVTHPAVPLVSFTGGLEVGRAISRSAGLKRLQMELGANNAVLVAEDADLDLAIDRIGSGAFWAAGQNCLHVQRVYVHETIRNEFVDRLVGYASAVRLGPKLSDDTDMGPMIDGQSLRRVHSAVQASVDDGADLLIGGDVEGSSYQPTLLIGASGADVLAGDEIYGPVTAIMPFRDFTEAIDRANSSGFGLQGAVFTSDVATAFQAAAALRTGGVMINESTDFRIDAMPFGGIGLSGLGREGVAHTVQAMTEPKVVAFTSVEIPGLG